MMKIPCAAIALTVGFSVCAVANAASFEGVINAMAIPKSMAHTNNGWEDTQKIKGVRWKWPYYQSGAHDHTMHGTSRTGKDKNPNIGAVDVVVSGARSMITEIEVSVANSDIDIQDFGPGITTKIKTSCDGENSASQGASFFRFEKSGFKPLFMLREFSYGASGSGSASVTVAYDLDDLLSNTSGCKVISLR